MEIDLTKYMLMVEKHAEAKLTTEQAEALDNAAIQAVIKDPIRLPWGILNKLRYAAIRTAQRVENESTLAALRFRESNYLGAKAEFELDDREPGNPTIKIYPKGKPAIEVDRGLDLG